MTQIVQSLSEMSAAYDAVFCDLWGCLHNGQTAYPAAVEALRGFKAKGGTVVLMTNAPRPSASVIAQLDRIGVPRDCYDIVVSSGDAAQAGMMSGAVGRRVYHLGPEKDAPFFTDLAPDLRDAEPITLVPLAEAEGIICTGPFHEDTETPEDYRATFLLAKTKGLKLLCANPDIIVDLGDRRIYCAGALAQLYDQMGGESLYYGKPHPPIYDLARNKIAHLGIPDDRILAIGDGVNTDVQGGIAESIDTLFVTGGIAAEDFGSDPDAPDAVLLGTWLSAQSLSPTAAIGRLR